MAWVGHDDELAGGRGSEQICQPVDEHDLPGSECGVHAISLNPVEFDGHPQEDGEGGDGECCNSHGNAHTQL